MNETSTLTPEQVHAVVQEMRDANYNRVGQDFFEKRVERLNAAGWVLGVRAYRHKLFKGRRGHLLRKPRYEWRNDAYFFNVSLKARVFYWDNDGYSKFHAEDLAQRTPAPKLPSGQYFTTFYKPTVS
jgi:hypothetical protein